MIYCFEKEKSEQRLVKSIVKPGMVVFDVGANDGDYSILFSQLVQNTGKVYSFEPTSSVFTTLVKRLKSFNCENLVTINKAVFSENTNVLLNQFEAKHSRINTLGRAPVMPDPENPGKMLEVEKTESVEAICLDYFCQQNEINQIDYLKVDVEGFEIDVLRGASQLLRRTSISFIQFEISELPLRGASRQAREIFDFLTKYKYQCHRIQNDGKIGEQVYDSNSFYENYIAFPTLPVEYSHFKSIIDDLSHKFNICQDNLNKCQEDLGKEKNEVQVLHSTLLDNKNLLEQQKSELRNLVAQNQHLRRHYEQSLERFEKSRKKLKEKLQRRKAKIKQLSKVLRRNREKISQLQIDFQNLQCPTSSNIKGRFLRFHQILDTLKKYINFVFKK